MPTWGHGKYGKSGGTLIGEAFDRWAADRFIRSDPDSRRGYVARLRYLTTHRGGMDALAGQGMKSRPRQIRQWMAGAVVPRRSTRAAVDAAYRELRGRNVAGALRRKLADGRRITVEPLPPSAVPADHRHRQAQLSDRETTVDGRMWSRFVGAWEAGDDMRMDDLWIEVCQDLGSPPEVYFEVRHVGFTI